jgi:hypothetical protein
LNSPERHIIMLAVIDYCEVAFELLLRQPVPARRGGKFIVLINAGKKYVVFSPKELTAFHADIARRFFELNRIACNTDAKCCQPGDSAWQVPGGAHWTMDDHARTLVLFGASDAYGGVDLHELVMELAAHPDFADTLVSVRAACSAKRG